MHEAKQLLAQHRIEKLPLVDDNGHLKGLITIKDIQKKRDYPNAAIDSRGRLLCAAAVGVGEKAIERARALIAAGVDVVSIDTAHGHSKGVIETIPEIKRLGNVCVLAGNVVTREGVRALVQARCRCDQDWCGRRLHLHHQNCERRRHAPNYARCCNAPKKPPKATRP